MYAKITCLCIALLALSVCFVAFAPRFSEDDTAQSGAYVYKNADRLESFRLVRAETRERELMELMSVMTDAEVDDDIRRDAGEMRLALIANMDIETVIEGTLMSRGLGDAVCTIRGESVNIIIRSKELTQKQSSIIMELASRESGRPASQIKIIPVS